MTQIVKNGDAHWLEITPDPKVDLWYVETSTGETRTFRPKENRVLLGHRLPEPVYAGLTPATITRGQKQTYTYPEAPAPVAPYIGCPVGASSNFNFRLGRDGTMALRIPCTHTGRVKIFRTWWKTTDPGQTGDYSNGNGGSARVSFCNSPGSFPVNYYDVKKAASQQFQALENVDVNWVAGNVYWVVFENTDPKPLENWVSINNLATFGDPPNAGPLPEVWYLSGSSWKRRTAHCPNFEIVYEDGYTEGLGFTNVPHAYSVKDVAVQSFTLTEGFRFNGIGYGIEKGSPVVSTVTLRGRGIQVAVEDHASPGWNFADAEGWLDPGDYEIEVRAPGCTFTPMEKGDSKGYLNPSIDKWSVKGKPRLIYPMYLAS